MRGYERKENFVVFCSARKYTKSMENTKRKTK